MNENVFEFWPEGLPEPDPAVRGPQPLWLMQALQWLAALLPDYLVGHEDALTGAPGVLCEIVRFDVDARLTGARNAYSRIKAHLEEGIQDPAKVASAPVMLAVVAEGRRVAAADRQIKAVLTAVLEHQIFAGQDGRGLERRIVFVDEDEGEGEDDRGVAGPGPATRAPE